MSADFNAALAAFQAAIPNVGKDQTAKVPTKAGGSYSYSYADLTTITSVALPLLAKHGLSFSARPTMTPDFGFVLAYELAHSSGEGVSGFYPLPDPARASAQEIGSAITYARRYCLCAATGIAPGGEDDDGAKASEARAEPRQQSNGHSNGKPVVKPPLLVAKERIWSVAQQIGWDKEDIGLNYAKDHDGQTVESATVEELEAWATALEVDLAS